MQGRLGAQWTANEAWECSGVGDVGKVQERVGEAGEGHREAGEAGGHRGDWGAGEAEGVGGPGEAGGIGLKRDWGAQGRLGGQARLEGPRGTGETGGQPRLKGPWGGHRRLGGPREVPVGFRVPFPTLSMPFPQCTPASLPPPATASVPGGRKRHLVWGGGVLKHRAPGPAQPAPLHTPCIETSTQQVSRRPRRAPAALPSPAQPCGLCHGQGAARRVPARSSNNKIIIINQWGIAAQCRGDGGPLPAQVTVQPGSVSSPQPHAACARSRGAGARHAAGACEEPRRLPGNLGPRGTPCPSQALGRSRAGGAAGRRAGLLGTV